MDRGYLKLWRKSLDSEVFASESLWKLWCCCLMLANHKEKYFSVDGVISPVKVGPGQFVTGRFSIHKIMYPKKSKKNPNPLTVWRWLQSLENSGNLNIKTNNKYSLITIMNWDSYQVDENGNEHAFVQQMNNNCTTDEQQMNTNKNVKNDKNDKKKDICTESQKSVAQNLIKIVSLRRKTNITQSQENVWANTIRLMETRDGISTEQMSSSLAWYEKNWMNEFVPVIESACAFREKWTRLLNAIERDKKTTTKDTNNGFDQRDYQKHATPESDLPDFLR